MPLQELEKAVPLGVTVHANGRICKLVERIGKAAIYEFALAGSKAYETIVIRIAEEHTWPNGQTSPRREVYPYAEQWGKYGWTFTRRSHTNPLAAAKARFATLHFP
jgi:hypothetical protein